MTGLMEALTDIVTPKPTALVPVANGSEEMEVAGLTDVLSRGGVRVTIADVDGDDDHLVTLTNGLELQADKSIFNCGDDAYDLIVVPGGTGAKTLSACPLLIQLLRQQKASGKWFGGICAGPIDVLLHHALVTGPMTCHPEYAAQAGELYREAAVVVAANCVTSQGPATAIPMGLKLVELLRGEKTAYDVAVAMACPPTQP